MKITERATERLEWETNCAKARRIALEEIMESSAPEIKAVYKHLLAEHDSHQTTRELLLVFMREAREKFAVKKGEEFLESAPAEAPPGQELIVETVNIVTGEFA